MKMNIENKFKWQDIRFIPILHNKMEFALEVRKQFAEFKPNYLAVEFSSTLKKKIIEGVKRLPLLSVVYYQEKGFFNYIPIEPTDGQIEGIRLALSEGIPIHFIDRDVEYYSIDIQSMPDTYAITKTGYFSYCQACIQYYKEQPVSHLDLLREKTMAYHLKRLNQQGKTLFIGGLAHFSGILSMLDEPQTEVIGRIKRNGVMLAHLHNESSREIMSELPFLAATYEKSRENKSLQKPDRLAVNMSLINMAKNKYIKEYKEDISLSQIRILNKFARNYTFLTGNLVPNFYQLIVASRGAVDDNFSYEVWELGSNYPWQTEKPQLPILRLRGEDLFLDQKIIKFHRRLKGLRRRLVPLPVKKKKREKHPGEWRKGFKGNFICSYPPEDVAIEGFGSYLKKKAMEIKAAENIRLQPFSSSMLDGIDIKATIRDYGQKRIYVKAEQPLRGKVGSVVIIFDTDISDKDEKEKYPWKVTWLGEHDQESDMAFYSTYSGIIMDGPGISRCQYGGFMLSYPPMRVYDIWKDSYFNIARNKPERLLLAALDYSIERIVVYVAADPPSGWCQNWAARSGKKILYLPIGTLAPATLKKMRQFHVLDGHPVRKYVSDYI